MTWRGKISSDDEGRRRKGFLLSVGTSREMCQRRETNDTVLVHAVPKVQYASFASHEQDVAMATGAGRGNTLNMAATKAIELFILLAWPEMRKEVIAGSAVRAKK